MKVTVKNQVISLEWEYQNPELKALIEEKQLKVEDIFKVKSNGKRVVLNQLELSEKLGIDHKDFPHPLFTICRMKNAKGEIMSESRIKKSPKDQFSKSTARRISFARALWQFLPVRGAGSRSETKAARREFWDAYFTSKGLTRKEKNHSQLQLI